MLTIGNKRGHLMVEYGLVVATAGLALGILGSQMSQSIKSAIAHNGTNFTQNSPSSSAPVSQACLEGAHPKSKACENPAAH